jgi:RNA polymerase-binding protein DksA
LRLRVAPGAKQAAVIGRHGDGWKLRVAAAPERGRANEAVLALLAETLALPRSSVNLVSGGSSRDKIVELTGLEPDEIERRLAIAGGEERAMTTDTDRFRGELLNWRARLQETMRHHDIGGASLTDETGDLNSSSADNHLADSASDTYERELDEGLEEDAERQLGEVEAALARIDDGTYGTCRVCGKEIPAERLEAVPWTTLCIEDARKQVR